MLTIDMEIGSKTNILIKLMR